ncbi:cysteine desulfurase [bacterium]|nr:cysteine desulfurase [bacterium]
MEEAREKVAAFLGCRTAEVFFTSGGSEAVNWAVKGSVLAHPPRFRPIVTGVLEHESMVAAVAQMEGWGCSVHRLGCDGLGRYRWEELESAPVDACVASFQLGNSETGTLQDLAAPAAWCETHAVPMHVDAIQAAGRVPIDATALGADLLSIAGHKFGAPKGVGALVIRGRAKPAPLISGGGQERGLRAGTENLPGIVGLGVAAEETRRMLTTRIAALTRLTDLLWRRMVEAIPDAQRNGDPTHALPGVLSLALPGCDAETLVAALDLSGLAISAGPACSSGALVPSRVLSAMGLPPQRVRASIRLAVSQDTTPAMLDRLVAELKTAVDRQRGIV